MEFTRGHEIPVYVMFTFVEDVVADRGKCVAWNIIDNIQILDRFKVMTLLHVILCKKRLCVQHSD